MWWISNSSCLFEAYKVTKYEETKKFLENEKKVHEINIAYENILKLQHKNEKIQKKGNNEATNFSANQDNSKNYINTQNVLILAIILILLYFFIFINS